MEELQPIYSNVKSFYRKARVLKDDDTIQLISYSTKVAEIKKRKSPYIWLVFCDDNKAYQRVFTTKWI